MDTLTIVYICAEAVLGLLSALVNCCVFCYTCRTRHSDLIRKTFVMNMVAADFTVGLFVAPASVMVYAGLPRHCWGCYAVTSAILGVTYMSVLTRIALAMERFIAICKPFLHERAFTLAKSVSLGLCIWPLGLIMSFIPMYFWNTIPDDLVRCTFFNVNPLLVYYQLIIVVLIPFALMTCAYVYFLVIVHRYRRRARGGQAYAMFIIDKSVIDTLERDVKITMIVPGLLILLFFIFWLPFNILFSLAILCPSCDFSKASFSAALMWTQVSSLTYPILTCIIRRCRPDVYGNVNDQLERIIHGARLTRALKSSVADQIVSKAGSSVIETAEELKQEFLHVPETVTATTASELVETTCIPNPVQDQKN